MYLLNVSLQTSYLSPIRFSFFLEPLLQGKEHFWAVLLTVVGIKLGWFGRDQGSLAVAQVILVLGWCLR